jgi:hypothetical protein
VLWTKEVLLHPDASGGSDPVRAFSVGEQPSDGLAHRLEVTGVRINRPDRPASIWSRMPPSSTSSAALASRIVPDDAAVEPASGVGDQVAQRFELPYREHRLEAQGSIASTFTYCKAGILFHSSGLIVVAWAGRKPSYCLLPGATIAAWAAATRAIGTRNGEQLT